MTIVVLPTSGFAAFGGRPTRENVLDWVAWHFTYFDNLPSIAESGCLHCDDNAPEHRNVGNLEIKANRGRLPIRAAGYPVGRMVSAHVPAYYAAQSPMLYRKTEKDGVDRNELIFLGTRVGDVVDSGLDWVASDANAASPATSFTTDVQEIPHIVDFPLLTQQQWGWSMADPGRPTRRAAELLVYQTWPLSLVTVVGATSEARADRAIESLGLDNRYIEKVVGYDLYF